MRGLATLRIEACLGTRLAQHQIFRLGVSITMAFSSLDTDTFFQHGPEYQTYGAVVVATTIWKHIREGCERLRCKNQTANPRLNHVGDWGTQFGMLIECASPRITCLCVCVCVCVSLEGCTR